MKLKKEDEMLGVVAATLMENREGVCPTDEEFALYLERRLNNYRRKAIITHFVSCQNCLERLTIPVHPLEVTKEGNFIEKFLAFWHRPLVVAPVAVIFVALLTVSLNVYIKSQDTLKENSEEIFRSPNLVSLKQIDLTPGLLTTIRGDDEERLKNELIKELAPGVEVTHIFVDDKLKDIKGIKEGDKITLILYSNGLLKVKLEE